MTLATQEQIREQMLRTAWIPTLLFASAIGMCQLRYPGGFAMPWYIVAMTTLVTTPATWWAVAGRGRWPRATAILAGILNSALILVLPTMAGIKEIANHGPPSELSGFEVVAAVGGLVAVWIGGLVVGATIGLSSALIARSRARRA